MVESAGDVTLTERLAVLQDERHQLVVAAVGAAAAKILGQPGPESVDRDLTFAELGFDSEMTVELRNRLAALTGLRLPDTIGWDYGSGTPLAPHFGAELSRYGRRVAAPL